MKIGIISDTHIPEAQPQLWPQVFEAFKGVDCILHAGDITDASVLAALSAHAPVHAVLGNNDHTLRNDLPERITLDLD